MPKLFTLPQTHSPQCEPVGAVVPFRGAVRQRADILARAGFGAALADGVAGCDEVRFQRCRHGVAEIAGRGSPPASLHLGNRTDDDDLRGYTE